LDILIPVLLYAAAFVITYAQSGKSVIDGYNGDRSGEYLAYLRMIDENRWVDDYLVNACLLSTYIPSLVYRLVKRGRWVIFKASAPVFFSLMPVFTYLIARQYFNVPASLIAAAFVLSNFYFLGDADTGRNGIACGVLSCSIWAFTGGHYLIFGISAVLVIASHYATTFIYLFVLCMTLMLSPARDIQPYIVTGIYGVLTLLWYGVFTRLRMLYFGVVDATLKGKPSQGTTKEYGEYFSAQKQILRAVTTVKKHVITKSRVLLVTTVLILVMILAGYILFYRYLSPATAAMITSFLLVTAVSILSPAIGTAVGIYRVYFTGMPVIALLFAGCILRLSNWTGFTAYGVAAAVIIIYGLCNSGGMAYLLGEKSK